MQANDFDIPPAEVPYLNSARAQSNLPNAATRFEETRDRPS
jgi:hypothetical protein